MKTINNSLTSLSIAKSLLLDPCEITETHISQVINEIFLKRIDYADLYFQYARSENWNLEEGIVKTGNYCINRGVGIRAISGEKTAFAYSDSLSPDILSASAKTVRSIAQHNSSGTEKLISQNSYNIENDQKYYKSLDPLKTLNTLDKVNLLKRIDKIARSYDARIVQVMANLNINYEAILIANSDGKLISDIRPLVRLSLTVIAQHNGRREIGHAGGGGRVSLMYFSDEVLKEYIEHAVHEAIINLEARAAPAGEMTVVLGAGWPGILLHEAVGHGLEGDFNRKGSSIFSESIGKKVAASGVTVIDNGTLPNRRGSLNIDDEGNSTQSNILIEDGILCNYMQDTLNARLMKKSITGNGRRQSYAHLPMPRMTNTYMLGGNIHPSEIIDSVQKGLYAVNFSGGQVDITNGKFVFSASEAYMIEHGKITYPVKGATIIGNGPEIMKKISMVGNDLKLDSGIGTCGKEGQSVPVGVGLPTLRINGLTVGGTGES
ncbi:MAG: metalloprotease TldD [Bordetella sp.]|nr:MAG: metalloprotease TldD [Bordetella sp.]